MERLCSNSPYVISPLPSSRIHRSWFLGKAAYFHIELEQEDGMFAVMSVAVLLPRQTPAMTFIPVCRCAPPGHGPTRYRGLPSSPVTMTLSLHTRCGAEAPPTGGQDVHVMSPAVFFMLNNQRESLGIVLVSRQQGFPVCLQTCRTTSTQSTQSRQ